jgi:hypothetical protein
MMGKNGTNEDTKELWKLLPENSLGAEIGVWKGESTNRFLRRARHIHMVDPWSITAYDESTDWLNIGVEGIMKRYAYMVGSTKREDYEKFYDELYESVCEKFKDKPVTIHRMTSTEFFNMYEGEKLDWIYIDGDHAYEAVYADLNNCLKVMKEGARIYCDDIAADNRQHPGVRQAVSQFCKENDLTPRRKFKNQCIIQL